MLIPVSNGQLPSGFCPPDLQTMLNGFTAAQFVNFSTVNGVVVSSTPPGASDHDKPWLQLDTAGRPVRLYFFAQGAWLSQHPLQPGFTMIWNQALPNFQTFDGGDASAAPYAAISGQMWQLCSTTLDGLGTQVLNSAMPLGVGTLPSGATVGLAQTGGEDLHKLTQQELWPHAHGTTIAINRAVPNGGQVDPSGHGGFAGSFLSDGGTEIQTRTVGGDPSTGNPPIAALPHNTLSPYYGVYFLQRTQRLFYVV